MTNKKTLTKEERRREIERIAKALEKIDDSCFHKGIEETNAERIAMSRVYSWLRCTFYCLITYEESSNKVNNENTDKIVAAVKTLWEVTNMVANK